MLQKFRRSNRTCKKISKKLQELKEFTRFKTIYNKSRNKLQELKEFTTKYESI